MLEKVRRERAGEGDGVADGAAAAAQNLLIMVHLASTLTYNIHDKSTHTDHWPHSDSVVPSAVASATGSVATGVGALASSPFHPHPDQNADRA